MVLSETEAEAQLAALRSQRDALDRAIADLSLYLELGRRLRSGPASPAETQSMSVAPAPSTKPSWPDSWSSPDPADRADAEGRGIPPRVHRAEGAQPMASTPPSLDRRGTDAAPTGDEIRMAAAARSRPEKTEPDTAGRGSADPASTDGALSEGVLARRYGRALIEAALAALDEAGRPLHAGEILAVLARRGFSLPGHDPVAALNTRLWKRSGPGGPLKRMGDAVYALAEAEESSDPEVR